MSLQFNQENAFDFFKKKDIHINKDSSKPARYTAMALYTLSKVATPKNIVYTVIGAMIFTAPIKYFNHQEHAEKIAKQEEQRKAQQEFEDSKLEMQKKSLKLAAEVETDKELYKLIKKFPAEGVNSTIDFINETQEKELKRLNTLYWTMVYMSQADDEPEINMEVVNEQIQKNIARIKEHYANRKNEILLTYSLVQSDQTNGIERTYDEQSAAKTLISWVGYTRTKADINQPETDQLYAQWMKILKNPTALAQYLQENKVMIEKASFVK